MGRAAALLFFVLAACSARRAGISQDAAPAEVDLLLHNARIFDGTGGEPVAGDVAVKDGRIAVVAPAARVRARETLDLSGLAVSPGFIDVHNHSEFAVADPARRFNEGYIRQGVTTIVGGPDGSMTPEQMRNLIARYAQNGVATNVAFYVGHNAIRVYVMGMSRNEPTPAELEEMKRLVREGMELGAVGFSTGLMYEPGMFTHTDEIVALAREVAPFHGIYDSHVRNPAHALIESDRETIEVGERAGVPPKIAHEKAVGLENKGLIREVIRLVEAARARGVNVATDQYPYDGAATAKLTEIVIAPPDVDTRAGFDLKAALRDPGLRRRFKETSENGIRGGFAWLKATGYSHMRITSSRDYPELVGRYLSELARERNQEGFDLVCDLILGAASPVGITLGAVHEQDLRDLLVQPWNMIASDGTYSDGVTPQGHPRSTGTFPRVLGKYVRELRLLSLSEAIRKMTSFPAEYVGLADRGRVAAGYAADLVVFDPETIGDRSTWDEPQLYAQGVVHVIVNGAFVLRNGKLTGSTPGLFLKHRGLTTTTAANIKDR